MSKQVVGDFMKTNYDNGINGNLGTGDGFIPVCPSNVVPNTEVTPRTDYETINNVSDKEFEFSLTLVTHLCTFSNVNLLAHMLASMLIDGLLPIEKDKDKALKYYTELSNLVTKSNVWSVEEAIQNILKFNPSAKLIEKLDYPIEFIFTIDSYPVPVPAENSVKYIFRLINEFIGKIKPISDFRRCRIISTDANLRLPLLRNVAVNNAVHNWIVFRDDDDLSCSLNELKQCFDSCKERDKYVYSFNIMMGNTHIEDSINAIDNTDFINGKSIVNGMWRMIINKKFVHDNGIFNQPSIMYGEDSKYCQIMYIYFNKYIKAYAQDNAFFYYYNIITRRNNNDANIFARLEEYRYSEYYKNKNVNFSFRRNDNPITYLWNHSEEELEMFKNNLMYTYTLNYAHFYEQETGYKIETKIENVVESQIGINIYHVNENFIRNDFGSIFGRYLGLEYAIKDAKDDKENDCIGKCTNKIVNNLTFIYGNNPRYYHYDQVLLFKCFEYVNIGPFKGLSKKLYYELPSFITIRNRKITIDDIHSIGVENWNKYLDTCNINDFK